MATALTRATPGLCLAAMVFVAAAPHERNEEAS
jgi:hypothetical protein